MNTQSNNPLPTTPQKWKEGQYIYYFNHKDNGVQLVDERGFSNEGRRYTSEFLITDSLDEIGIKQALMRSIIDPVLDQKVVDNIEVERKPAIKAVKIYKETALTTSKISEILVKAPITFTIEKQVVLPIIEK